MAHHSTWNGPTCSTWSVGIENIQLIEEDGKVERENNPSPGYVFGNDVPPPAGWVAAGAEPVAACHEGPKYV